MGSKPMTACDQKNSDLLTYYDGVKKNGSYKVRRGYWCEKHKKMHEKKSVRFRGLVNFKLQGPEEAEGAD